MKHDIDDILSQVDTLADDLTRIIPSPHAINRGGMEQQIQGKFPWIRYDGDLLLISGMLISALLRRGWDVDFSGWYG